MNQCLPETRLLNSEMALSPHSPVHTLTLLTKQEDRTPPAWVASAGDGHLQPPRLAWGEDTPVASGRPDAGGQLAESHGHMGQGSRASNFQGRSRRSPSAGGPLSPREASCFQQVVEGSRSRAESELGLGFASSPVEEPVAMESCSGEQSSCGSRGGGTPRPARGHPLAQLREPLDLGSKSESAPSTCSGSSARSPTPRSGSVPSCPSLQESQEASAILVQLSESSVSLSDGEARNTPGADLSQSGGLSAGGSRGSHWGGGPEPAAGLPNTLSPRSGSELSEASSEVWDREGLREPGAGAGLAPACCLPTGGSSHLEHAGGPLSCFASWAQGRGRKILEPVGARLVDQTQEKPKGGPQSLLTQQSHPKPLPLVTYTCPFPFLRGPRPLKGQSSAKEERRGLHRPQLAAQRGPGVPARVHPLTGNPYRPHLSLRSRGAHGLLLGPLVGRQP
ncbi:uncharacterized protein LOC114884512 [Monodon monoceros]|uniref:uncharacterized protein LOC114884512 n=1 Tax=Monodon monoceros TaxID=40151 RepID=UPI0010F97588|nr:uncharacterized protein LOC114884512 [Monodon monoceros]